MCKFPTEKLYLSFSRFKLGVHRKAQNTVVFGEFGCDPLGIDITDNLVMYL